MKAVRPSPYRKRTVGALVGALALVAAACVAPSGPPVPAIRMDAARSGGFFSLPWPNDIRRAPDGTLDLTGLPGVDPLPGETPTFLRSLLPAVMSEIGRSLTGFGINTATYFESDRRLDDKSFPTPSASTEPTSPVLLIDLDHPGERLPVIVDFQVIGDRNRPDNLLTILPYPGHPLRESTRYAVSLTRGLRAKSGQHLAPSPLLAQLDRSRTPATGVAEDDWNELRDQRNDVRSVLEDTTSWNASDLVAFTVFSTQDVDGDLQAVAAAAQSAPAPTVNVISQGPCSVDDRAGGSETSSLIGTIELTRWQSGTYPYYDGGGEIVVGNDGLAVPQGTFAAEFTARIPCGAAPAAGWPLLTFIDGTAGGFDLGSTTLPLTYEGYAIAEISPVYGIGRGITITPLMAQLGINTAQDASNFTFYNFLNPDAARTNTIQQTGENLQLLEAFEHVGLDGAGLGTTGAVGTNPAIQVVSGQSQGAQTLPMVAAMRPSLAGVVSSAGSGGIYHTLAHHQGNRIFLGQLTGDAQALDELNPVVQVAQSMLEGGDGVNYPSTTNYLNYDGRDDTCVPFETSRYFAGATGLPAHYASSPTSLYGDPGVDPPTTDLPVRGNVGGRTRVSVERPGQHYVAYDQLGVTAGFLSDIASARTPTVAATGYSFGFYSGLSCGAVRWDVPPTRFAR